MLNHFAFRAERWVTREEVWTFTRSPVCVLMLCTLRSGARQGDAPAPWTHLMVRSQPDSFHYCKFAHLKQSKMEI